MPDIPALMRQQWETLGSEVILSYIIEFEGPWVTADLVSEQTKKGQLEEKDRNPFTTMTPCTKAHI